MTDDVLDRLRSSNPVPRDEIPAPPLETVVARLRADEPEPEPRWVSRMRGWLVPALGVAATLAVAVIAFSVIGHRDRMTASGPVPALLPTPRLGMPGVVQVDGAAFPSEGTGAISIEQCFPCGPRTQLNRTWTVVAGGEGSWHLHRTPSMGSPEFSGEVAGWAIGMSFAPNGGIVSAPYVTHDGGRTWARASLPPGASNATVSVAGATAWATASTDRRHVIVLNGPARGTTLTRVARLRFASDVAASIVAGNDSTAYLEVARKFSTLHLVTHDAGQTWQQLPAGCSGGSDSTLSVDSTSSLWRLCGDPTVTVGHSTDGGRSWRTFHVTAPGRPIGSPLLLRAASPSTAWMLSNHGDVFRITGGGAHSQRVWSVTRSQRTAVGGRPEALTAITENTAYLTVLIPPVKHGHTNGTYLVVYETRDGGRTWQPHLVTLTHR
jgi:photosystem II stability/assembly factor-like uncharacterized protein